MRKGLDYTGVSLVFMCHDGNKNYLLQKRSNKCRDEHDCWSPASGGLKFKETIEEGIKREIQEEFMVDPISYEPIGFRELHREHEGEKTHWIALDFLVHVDPSKVQIGEPDKCDEIRWVTVDTIPRPRHSQFAPFLEKYLHLF